MASDREILKMLGTAAAPFMGRFKSLTEVQRRAVAPILSGKDVLLASATASGKTEAIVAPLVARLQSRKSSETKSGVKILVVAPTRALVNDLFNRLHGPLSETGWMCGRQTSDHRDKGKKPHMLITTPESFDSMLSHDITRINGSPVGHLLATVKAVFLDEAHLYENSARGEHVAWLVARLKRLKKYAFQKGWIASEHIQLCAGSATVSHTSSLAERLLGHSATVIRVGGDREIEMYDPGPPRQWKPIRSSAGLAAIQDMLDSLLKSEEELVEFIWGAIENAARDGLRKLLVFVSSRKLCDLLSADLSACLGNRRNIYVSGHHGSLDKSKREEAEQMFAACRDAVLVATSTLEVGIDIGDVDIIVLVGAPPDTSALLQRIGRGGRRSGLIKIVPLPKDSVDAYAFSSMLLSACQGILEASPPSRRWAVFVQQTISLIMQSGGKGRKPEDLFELVDAVWGKPALPTAHSVIDHLVSEEWLINRRDRLFLGEHFSDGVHNFRAYYHCNFETEGPTIPVVDNLTRQTIGHVKNDFTGGKKIAIGGRTVDVVHGGEEIVVKTRKSRALETFNYTRRRPILSKSFAEHVQRGMGFAEDETLVYESDKWGSIWFHFGGGLYEWVLNPILGSKIKGAFMPGLALKGTIGEEDIRNLSSTVQDIRSAVDNMKQTAAPYLGAGRFHKYLPESVQAEVISSIFDIDGFLEWAGSRTVTPVHPGSEHWEKIRHVFFRDAS